MKLKNILIILLIFQIVNHVVVFANGRDVAISEEDVMYSCKCIDGSGNEYQIDKLSIDTNEKGQSKNLLAKKGLASVSLSLIKLEYINFDENAEEISEEGYVKAKVKFNHRDTEKEYFIFVGTINDPVYLNGIDEDSGKISIKLKDCKRVLFKDISKDYQELPPQSSDNRRPLLLR